MERALPVAELSVSKAPSDNIKRGRERKKHMLKRILLGLFAAALLIGVSGCNTVEGAGEDIESVGEELQD
jgi:predicted small secreted protein